MTNPIIERIRKEADYVVRKTQKELMRLYNMESHIEELTQLLELFGSDVTYYPDASFYSNEFKFYYKLKEYEGLKTGKVYDILAWCVDNLDYDKIQETTSNYSKTWVFEGDLTVRLTFDVSNSTHCKFIETGEYYDPEPKLKLVCS